ncbi:hypothetical protein CABS01_10244 [Colletotrichum abscissum]|uniref:uncharacterized protein n=1 Tax=Colletotrichum abscissum TaxID=1671311 RepID=UPI0027D5D398|nr:uncharacterized protein CABS01_10244 [Colletotrichum abscissum]KAK1499846.1 hypothetical protein CABS01_10244 [Colletotrichum abscissum]
MSTPIQLRVTNMTWPSLVGSWMLCQATRVSTKGLAREFNVPKLPTTMRLRPWVCTLQVL